MQLILNFSLIIQLLYWAHLPVFLQSTSKRMHLATIRCHSWCIGPQSNVILGCCYIGWLWQLNRCSTECGVTNIWYAAGDAGLVSDQEPTVTRMQLGKCGVNWTREQTSSGEISGGEAPRTLWVTKFNNNGNNSSSITSSCLGGVAVRHRTRDRKVAGLISGRGAVQSTRSAQPSIPLGSLIEYQPAWLG